MPGSAQSRNDLATLGSVLTAVRAGVSTKPELARRTGLGRNLITQRVNELGRRHLVVEGAFAPSTGGRAPREVEFNAGVGTIVVAELGATGFSVGLSDLRGHIRSSVYQVCPINQGPAVVLEALALQAEALLTEHISGALWAVGVGLPGPVEFATGRPVAPPIMPGWDGEDVRRFFGNRFNVSTWVDNDVNLMALGEYGRGEGMASKDLIFVKVGTGIGAGLISRGQIHRGAQGCAGDIGHTFIEHTPPRVCRCGKSGCLEAQAGGLALAQIAAEAAHSGQSVFLRDRLKEQGALTAEDITQGADYGDPTCRHILLGSADLVGSALARLVSFFNPGVIILGGGVAESGPTYLAAVREVVLKLAPPLATRDLLIRQSEGANLAGMRGAALMVADDLLSARLMEAWLEAGSPAGMTELAALSLA